jgi:hypothetical protein
LANHPAPKVVALCLGPLTFDFRDADEWGGGITSHCMANYATAVGESVPLIDTAERFVRRGFGQCITCCEPDLEARSLRGDEAHTYRSYRAEVETARGFFPIGNGHSKDPRLPNIDLPYEISDRWAGLVSDLDRECLHHNCRLLVFFSPLRRVIIEQRDMTLADKWLKQVAADNPRVTVCGKAVWSIDEEAMYDCVHLNRDGVERFMPIVANEVQATLKKWPDGRH